MGTHAGRQRQNGYIMVHSRKGIFSNTNQETQICRQQIQEEQRGSVSMKLKPGKSQPCFHTYFGEAMIKKSQKTMMVEVRRPWSPGRQEGQCVGAGQEGGVFLKRSLIPKTWLFSKRLFF